MFIARRLFLIQSPGELNVYVAPGASEILVLFASYKHLAPELKNPTPVMRIYSSASIIPPCLY
jgi:hypothetical protein